MRAGLLDQTEGEKSPNYPQLIVALAHEYIIGSKLFLLYLLS